jgi:hypothetical protein
MPAVLVGMLLTMNLSASETAEFYSDPSRLKEECKKLAKEKNRRFAQIVSFAGRLLDVLEVEL